MPLIPGTTSILIVSIEWSSYYSDLKHIANLAKITEKPSKS
jgi:hypothetical protein